MLLGVYRLATELGAPLASLYLKRRVRQGKEEPLRLGERAGRANTGRPDGPLLWVHAASVGESLAALPLIAAVLDQGFSSHVLMTTGTVTSADLMAKRLPPRALHQFAPLDRAAAWRRFFAHWRPDAGLLIEQELWPNLLLEAKRAAVPLALVNGRMSARSAARWRWARSDAGQLLRSFTLCLARSETDAARLRDLGAEDVRVPGDLKNAAPPLPADPEALANLETAIGDRPVWLAASTHPGEEPLILAAHRLMRRTRPDLLTVIVPRHPARGGEIADLLLRQGEPLARRSVGDMPDDRTGIFLADTLGELGLFYRLARLVFIGGSFVPHGGQNPLEAARLGCPPLFGPHTGNFQEMTDSLVAKGAAGRVHGAESLANAVLALLADPPARERMAALGVEAGRAEAAVLTRVLQALTPLLDRRNDAARTNEPSRACA